MVWLALHHLVNADDNIAGTGNDLARVLRWGPGYNGEDEPLSLLRDVIEAEEIKLDRYIIYSLYRHTSIA